MTLSVSCWLMGGVLDGVGCVGSPRMAARSRWVGIQFMRWRVLSWSWLVSQVRSELVVGSRPELVVWTCEFNFLFFMRRWDLKGCSRTECVAHQSLYLFAEYQNRVYGWSIFVSFSWISSLYTSRGAWTDGVISVSEEIYGMLNGWAEPCSSRTNSCVRVAGKTFDCTPQDRICWRHRQVCWWS